MFNELALGDPQFSIIMVIQEKSIGFKKNFSHQVVRKTEEKKVTVEADKVKEEGLKVAGGRCWKRVWMKVLKKTGDHIFIFFFIFVQNMFPFS